MAKDIKTKKSFGTATIDHFIPAKQEEWPKAKPGAGDQVVGVQALACCFQPEGWTPTGLGISTATTEDAMIESLEFRL